MGGVSLKILVAEVVELYWKTMNYELATKIAKIPWTTSALDDVI